MANRAERRAQAKRNRRGIPSQYDQTRGRVRSGMIDEYQLQEKSRRLQEGIDDSGPWKPTAHVEDIAAETAYNTNPNYRNPSKGLSSPSGFKGWARLVSWVLIAVSIIGFFVVMWLPSHPLWLIITVSAVFIVGTLSLFFTAGDSKRNPNLDANGTAV